MLKDFRITSKVQNNLLLKAIEATGASSIAEFCRTHQMTHATLGDLINFKRLPIQEKSGRWRPIVVRLSQILLCLPEDLFAEAHYNTVESNIISQEVSQSEVEFILENVQDHDPQLALEHHQINQAIARNLQTLTPREEHIIRMRFGLDCEEMTLKAIEKKLGITQERVRQIEKKALRKLQHPKRSQPLREVYYGLNDAEIDKQLTKNNVKGEK